MHRRAWRDGDIPDDGIFRHLLVGIVIFGLELFYGFPWPQRRPGGSQGPRSCGCGRKTTVTKSIGGD
jgi:hypothetical protein